MLNGKLEESDEVESVEIVVKDETGKRVRRRIDGIAAQVWSAWIQTLSAEKEAQFRKDWEAAVRWVDEDLPGE